MHQQNCNNQQRGFTLVELIVAVGLFSVVVTIAVTTLVSVMNASARAQELHVTSDNLSFALDSISRTVRFGYDMYCTDDQLDSDDLPTGTQDCTNGGTTLVFTNTIGTERRMAYRYNATSHSIEVRASTDSLWVPLTSNAVTVDDMHFTVTGTQSGVYPSDGLQPQAILRMVAKPTGSTEEYQKVWLETVMTQRRIDI